MKTEDGNINAEIISSSESALRDMEKLLKNIYDYKYSMMNAVLSGKYGHERFKESPLGPVPEEWETATLEEIVSVNGIVEGPPENTLSSAAVEGGIPVIDGASVSTLRFNPEKCRLVPRDFLDTDSCAAAGCEIVLARRGPYAGACAIMPVFFTGGVLAPECVKIVPDTSRCEPFYLNNVFHHYFHSGTMDTLRVSSEEKEISLTLLKQLTVKLPPLEEQKSIAGMLLEISGKIVECEGAMANLKKIHAYFS